METSEASKPEHPTSFSKKSAFFFRYVTVFRFFIAVLLPITTLLLTGQNLSQFNHNTGWSYAFIHPEHTLRNLREGQFFLDHYKSRNSIKGIRLEQFQGLQNAYRSERGFFHLPPLSLVVFQPFFLLSKSLNYTLSSIISGDQNATLYSSNIIFCIQEVLFGILFILIDMKVAYLLMNLSQKLCNLRSERVTSSNCNYKGDFAGLTSIFRPFESYEREMELQMDCLIRPENGYLFGMPTLGNEPSFAQNEDETKSNGADSDEKKVEQKEYIQMNKTEASLPSVSITLPFSSISTCIFFVYYCNPIIIASSIYFHSFQGLFHFVYVAILLRAYNGNAPLAALLLSLWNYFEGLYPMLHMVSVILLVSRRHNTQKSAMGSIGYFCLWSFFLFYISNALIKDDSKDGAIWMDWVHPHSHNLGYNGLHPSLGVLWYFFIQVFFRFTDFFVILFKAIPCVFLVPLSLRLWRYPLELVRQVSYYSICLTNWLLFLQIDSFFMIISLYHCHS